MRDCAECADRQPQKNVKVRNYLAARAIQLRHGCLCGNERTYWRIPKIAEALGLPQRTVESFLLRWKRSGFEVVNDQRTVHCGRKTKLSIHWRRMVTSRTVLQRQAAMTLRERVADLHRRHGFQISASTLKAYYR